MTDPFPVRFPDQLRQHLRALRKRRGLTQTQLGALVGVSQARIAEIEANPGLVNFEQLMKLLSVLGVSLALHERTLAPTATSEPGVNAPTPVTAKPQQKTAAGKAQGKFVAPSKHRVLAPSKKGTATTLGNGANGRVSGVLVTPATPDRQASPSATSELKKSVAGKNSLPSTTAIRNKLRAPNPDVDVQPTSRRNFVVRPKKGSW
ncbi:MAG: helix-turn-helix domain-containing protein [Caldimonas sp.]